MCKNWVKGEVLGKGKVEAWIAKTTPHCLVAGAFAELLIDELGNTGFRHTNLQLPRKRKSLMP